MVRLEPPLRLATEADAPILAVLNNEASHGLALHAWGLMASPGEDAWEVGIARQRPRVRDGRWVVADGGAGPIAGLQTWSAAVRTPAAELPAIFHPLVDLEALAPDTLFVNLLAVLPEARGRGFGTRLMHVAQDIALFEGHPGLSLIVADDNEGARRLYARLGYRDRALRPMVKEGWDGPGSEWILLVKELGPTR